MSLKRSSNGKAREASRGYPPPRGPCRARPLSSTLTIAGRESSETVVCIDPSRREYANTRLGIKSTKATKSRCRSK